MPIFYGLWLARRMGPGRFLPVSLTTDRNVNAYAVRGDDGRVRIAVIQKEDPSTGAVRLDLAVGRGSGTAQVLRLTGGGLAAVDTTVQGGVDDSGRLAPGRAKRVRVRDGRLGVDLPAGSAVLITVDC